MSSASTEFDSLCKEITDSSYPIIIANSGHFIVLEILFLLPIFFSLIVYPSFYLALFHPDYDFAIFTRSIQSHLFFSNFEIITFLVYTLVLVLLYLCAVATITYSAVQASNGRPINVVSSIRSIKKSFFPLLSTFIVSNTIFISITLIFALVLVNWSLAYVIALVESKRGYETLRRSAYLVKGMRSLALWIHVLHGLALGGVVIGTNVYLIHFGAVTADQLWGSFAVIISLTFQCWVLGAMLTNMLFVVNVVLYKYYKDLNGEKLPLEIDGKFLGEFVSLSLDDDKNHGTL
ncbi:PREDICTED: uncharacterized protein LOC109222310 [Nicotiana attenuata]|uniref:uncharacterized protein LOC109222310 n=1 Tax=Nicotiana attenuata TaxID=49451 RepID=UPI000905503D|nr:PREDICTED: uncharacterized protein LOC109222310 [Nicotiana attenuata]